MEFGLFVQAHVPRSETDADPVGAEHRRLMVAGHRGPRLLEQHVRDTEFGGARRGTQTTRTCADDRDLKFVAHASHPNTA